MKVHNNPGKLNGVDSQKVDRLDLKSSKNSNETSGKSPIVAKDTKDSARVDLSQRALDMKKIKDIAVQTPDVDAEKVAKFQKLIDEGKYKVDTKEVADKMVDEFLLNND